jgi:hypothetical protein
MFDTWRRTQLATTTEQALIMRSLLEPDRYRLKEAAARLARSSEDD